MNNITLAIRQVVKVFIVSVTSQPFIQQIQEHLISFQGSPALRFALAPLG
jgi:hypothetical protein